MAEQYDDVALIRRWFQKLQLCIQAVDFTGSRPLFADDIITFGTFAAFTPHRAGLRDCLVGLATSASGGSASLTSQTKGATHMGIGPSRCWFIETPIKSPAGV